jgi:hypothetical protein
MWRPPTPSFADLARPIIRAQANQMANLGRLQGAWKCPECRFYRRMAMALLIALTCALILL